MAGCRPPAGLMCVGGGTARCGVGGSLVAGGGLTAMGTVVTLLLPAVSAGYLAALVLASCAEGGEPSKVERGSASWIAEGGPVPADVLYSSERAAPPFEAKPRSWHNKLLFPGVDCPYCGRRVPTKRGSYLFLVVGLLGQSVFSARFMVQWLASERAKRSVVPVSFWWLSIAGSALLLSYALAIKAIPIVLGQIPGFFIYARNLHLLRIQDQKGSTT